MRALGVVRPAIPQHIDEGLGGEDSRIRGSAVQLLNRHGRSQRRVFFHILDIRSRGRKNCSRQVVRRVGLRSNAVRQAYVECRFQPRQQFHTLQAAETQVAVELRRGVEHRQCALAAQFMEQATDYFQHAFAQGRAVELGDGSGHRTHEGFRFLPREATTPKRGLLFTSDRSAF